MGFLRRLAAGGSNPAARGVALNVTYFTRLRDDAALSVVGEYYRQDQIRRARPAGPGDLPPGLPAPPPGFYKAMLAPEPTNRYDPNAIVVLLWAGGDWCTAGYLSRDDAVKYQPVFRYLAYVAQSQSSPAIACDAALGPERDAVGVVLHLGTPGECVAELATDNRTPADHAWRGKPVIFAGEDSTTLYGVPLDREAQIMLARWAECEVLPRLTKKTALLIVADPGKVAGNVQKARDYGVAIEQESNFLAAIGIPPEAIGQVSQRWAARV